MKRKIFTLLLSAFLGNMAMAQAPEAVAKKTETLPVIDGVVDGIWLGANTYSIATPFQAETPTLGDAGTTTWKALWSDEGIYILLTVNDDEFYPAYMNGSTENWLYDKPEIYFDVNEVLKDGLGAKNANPGDGHWQVAPGFNESELNGEMKTDAGNGVVNAFLVTGQTYRAEYFVPFSWLKRGDGTSLDVTVPIGFDVTICDGESAAPGVRQRANWSNSGLEGAKAESWANMDDCGTMTFSEEVAVGGALIMKTEAAPAIDGEVDAMWENASANNIVVPFKEEAATVGDEGETTWKALWNDAGVYILVQVADDEWFPFWAEGGGANGYEYDKLELYFDSNADKKDGIGGQAGGTGHVQVAPDSKADGVDGTMLIGTDRMSLEYNYAIKVAAPTYVAEYFVPWDMLTDKDGAAFDKTTAMGFDITVIDRDAGDAARKRVNWANAGAKDENWNNMDDAGLIMFDGAVEVIYVDKVKVSGGTAITTDNGTLQMTATVEPADASAQKVKWVVENGTGKATISADGLLTAVMDGTVLVKGIAKDAYAAEGKVTVTISGQKITLAEINYLKNGNFDNLTATGGATDWSTGTVMDGELVFGPDAVLTNQWDLTLLQTTHIPFELKDEDFIISFRAWADEPRTLPLVFEDAFNDGAQWDAYASSTEMGWSDKTWTVDLTTEPTVFSIHLNFAPMQETTVQNFNFQVGLSAAKVHLDSIYLVRSADLALVSARSLANSKSKVQLYPNPVQNELIVSKIAVANSKVSVYNAVGQKLMEKTANGTQAKFDVANLKKGMYFVRFSDGTSEKFLKQ